jgi:LysM repeat protein
MVDNYNNNTITGQYYQVQPGDTFYLISKRFGISLDSLVYCNPHLTDPCYIAPGQIICIPLQPTYSYPYKNIQASDFGTNEAVYCSDGFTKYIVQPDDTGNKIAKSFGISFDCLKKYNPHIPNFNYIYPGMILCIPNWKC